MWRIGWTAVGAVAFTLFVGIRTLPAQPSPDTPRREQRLRALARLDAVVRLFDPTVQRPSPPFAWDSAFAERVSAILDAPSPLAYESQIAGLLATLGDPLSMIVRRAPRGWRGAWQADSIFRVWPGDGDAPRSTLAESVRRARGVIIDLREVAPGEWLNDTTFASALMVGSAQVPDQRLITYPHGMNAPAGVANGWPPSGGVHIAGRRWDGRSPHLRPMHILVDFGSVLPEFLVPLRSQPGVTVISNGPEITAYATRTHHVSMGEGVAVNVRIGARAGSTLAFVDSIPWRWIQPAQSCDPDRVAVSNRFRASRRDERACDRAWQDEPVPEAWSQPLPSTGYRILGAIRAATAAAMFAPDSVRRSRGDEMLPRMAAAAEDARTADEYTAALRLLTNAMDDARASVGRTDTARYIPIAPAPLAVRSVEGRVLVTRVLDSIARNLTAFIGAEIVGIEGRSVSRISDSLQQMNPNAGALSARQVIPMLARTSLDAAHDSLRLTLRTPDGVTHGVAVAYARPKAFDENDRTGRIIRSVASRTNYVDLVRVEPETIDSVFAVLDLDDDIVLDLRGWTRDDVVARVAARIRGATAITPYAASRTHAVATAEDTTGRDIVVARWVAPSRSRRGKGRIVALIDERSASAALAVRATSVRTFIGSPTEGLSTRSTTLSLPGNRTLRLPQDAATALTGVGPGAATNLDRIAVTPTLVVEPTLAGVRADRDEPLEQAVAMLGQRYIAETDGFVAATPYSRRALALEPAVMGWTVVDPDTAFRVGIDTTISYTGRGSAHFTTVDPTASHASLVQTIAADEFRGGDVLVSAMVRFGRAESRNNARAFVRVSEDDGTDAALNSNAPVRWVGSTMPTTRVTGWHLQRGAFTVSLTAKTLTIEIVVTGDGEVWVDDVVIERHPNFDSAIAAGYLGVRRTKPIPMSFAPASVPRWLANPLFERWQR